MRDLPDHGSVPLRGGGVSIPERDLIQQLRDQDAVVRRSAAQALGRTGRRGGLRELQLVLMEDTSAHVRRAAAEALGRIGDPGARATLDRSSKQDEDEGVRLTAKAALLRLVSASGETPAIFPTIRE